MRLGIIGGTFDPIHNGHLIIAQEAALSLKLNRVLFIPAGDPPHKQKRAVSAAHHRFAMVQKAIANNPLFEVSTIEIDRPGLSYTVETLATLRQLYQTDDEFFFIIGVDAVADMLSWQSPERVLQLAKLAVVARPGYSLSLEKLQAGLPNTLLSECLVNVETPQIEIASSWLRERVKSGLPIRYLVPDDVAAYIEENKLYQ